MTEAATWLRDIAEGLTPLLDRIVFVGGAVVHLLITDEAAYVPRATKDVDIVITAVSNYADLQAVSELLLRRGFNPDTDPEAPTCRWVLRGVKLDVMPAQAGPWGPSNQWYESAFDTAATRDIGASRSVRLITAPYFLATKLEAFASPERRRGGDIYASEDIEDLVAVVDGRPEVVGEVAGAATDVREFLAARIAGLIERAGFVDAALPGHLDRGDVARATIVESRLRQIAALSAPPLPPKAP
jgi:hypothetical protein